MSNDDKSSLLLDEFFSSEDRRFVSTLRKVRGFKKLAAFADRWKRDPRPWAREQIFKYLEQPLNAKDHQPIIKRLFKHADENRDDEMMGAFMWVFDRLVRFERKTRFRWNWETRESWEEQVLVKPRNKMPQADYVEYTGWRGQVHRFPINIRPSYRLFSYRTRYYLRRRAWRYFRHMAYQRPDDYPRAIAAALRRYTDADLSAGEHLLESWSLMHACFGAHEAVTYDASRFKLADGHTLAELTPAPRFVELWRKPESADVLFDLLTTARSRPVRVWAQKMLETEHEARLRRITADDLLTLLDHGDQELQQFGATLMSKMDGLATLPLETWLRLMATKNPLALATICETMAQHVTADRLELADCIDLTNTEATPVARMGLGFLKQRKITTPEDRDAIAAVADTPCDAVGYDVGTWALNILGEASVYDVGLVVRFFDSLTRSVRDAAWDWLTSAVREGGDGSTISAGYEDADLWSRLLETPFDDVRMNLVDLLQQRVTAARIAGRLDAKTALPGAPNADLSPIWTSVLLGVHRGGRQKIKAMRQISDALRDAPGRAEALLPVLAVAIRSVRPAEARPGLAAIVGAVNARPELLEIVSRYLPELDLNPNASAGGVA